MVFAGATLTGFRAQCTVKDSYPKKLPWCFLLGYERLLFCWETENSIPKRQNGMWADSFSVLIFNQWQKTHGGYLGFPFIYSKTYALMQTYLSCRKDKPKECLKVKCVLCTLLPRCLSDKLCLCSLQWNYVSVSMFGLCGLISGYWLEGEGWCETSKGHLLAVIFFAKFDL